jgi:PBP1b-binding outer membrane lipoprotein LpoB
MKVITNLSIIIYISLIINGCAAVKQIENTTKAIETCKFTLQSIEPSIKTNKAKISLSGIKGPSIDIWTSYKKLDTQRSHAAFLFS